MQIWAAVLSQRLLREHNTDLPFPLTSRKGSIQSLDRDSKRPPNGYRVVAAGKSVPEPVLLLSGQALSTTCEEHLNHCADARFADS